MSDDGFKQKLWTPRSVDETLQIYADWAETYDKDVQNSGYATPLRIAKALRACVPLDAVILDYGCGTGLSGQALKECGYHNITGTDISPNMLEKARKLDIYAHIFQSNAGELEQAAAKHFDAVVAAGVISLGAAPPETLDLCLSALKQGGIFAFSFNDPTIKDGGYDAALNRIIEQNAGRVLIRQHGPHLPGKNMGSDVIVLQKS